MNRPVRKSDAPINVGLYHAVLYSKARREWIVYDRRDGEARDTYHTIALDDALALAEKLDQEEEFLLKYG